VKARLAYDISQRLGGIMKTLELGHIDSENIVCMRSTGSKSRAIARIWGLPKIWQQALDLEPYYIVEVISEKYDKLSDEEKDKTLIHELMHIPKTFSGALVPHKCFGKKINRASVEKVYQEYLAKKQ